MRIIFLIAFFIFSFGLNLQKGWNLEGSSREINISDLNKSCIKIIWSYDKNWKYFSNEVNLSFPIIKTIKQNNGFWILAKNDCNISLPINNYQYQQMLKLGINVNWAIFPKEIAVYNSSYVDMFKNLGFKTIRLRFDFTDKVLNYFDNNKTKYINYLKKVTIDCLKDNLNVILANGASDFKNNPNDAALNDLVENWVLVAKAFKDFSKRVSYDFIIEPGKDLKKHNDLLNEFYKTIYNKIRVFDKKRILIWAPNYISNPYYLPQTWYPKNDNYVMAEWHMYAAGPKNGYEEDVPQKTKFAYNWSIKYHIPTWVGAWMPGNYNKGDTYSINEQIKFLKFMIDTLKQYNIPSAINADNQFYDYKTNTLKRKEVLEAIIEEFYK